MSHRRMLLLAGAAPWLACQPIVIGTPAESRAGASSAGSSSVLPGPGGAADGGSGAAGEGTSAAGDSTSAAGDSGTTAGGSAGEPSVGAGGAGPCTEGVLLLEGRVTTERGTPIIGAPVEIQGEPPIATITNDDGQYAFDNLCPGKYRVTAICIDQAEQVELTEDTVRDFRGTPGGCDTNPVRPMLLPVIYDPTMTGDGEPPQRLSTTLGVDAPDVLLNQLFDELRAATNGHMQFPSADVVSSIDFPPLEGGGRYTAAEYAACLNDSNDCRAAAVDFTTMEQQYQLCDAAQRQQVDQIWLLGGDHFGFADQRRLTCAPRAGEPETYRDVDVLGFSYAEGLSGLVAQYLGFADRALSEAFADDESAENPYTPFKQALQTQELAGCQEQQGSELGFERCWFGQLPRDRWLDAQGKYNDFWRYLVRPDDRSLPVAATRIACSSSWRTGWCPRVHDGARGYCNWDDWATASMSTGWVEFSFSLERLVSGLELYDRACEEQVMSGHLEFSDGSEDVAFGPLENFGVTSTRVDFEPKVLSGLRVVIDSVSSPHPNPNPGLGEVVLLP